MVSQIAHGFPGNDYSQLPFFIRRMDTEGYIKAAEVAPAAFPLVSFVFLTRGELLAEAGDQLFLCSAGQLLLIPEKTAFSIHYYQDAKGYTGGFQASLAGDLALLARPFHCAFWFDEASFVGELFNMMAVSFEKGRNDFIHNAIPLLLSMLPQAVFTNPQAKDFLKRVFDSKVPFDTLDAYATAAGLSPNGFCRMIRRESGRSPGEWIALARVTRAKNLLQNTDIPVIDVAFAVGLSDQSYFSRFFRLHTGMTPMEFRQIMKAAHKKS